ncbi:MAG TPA: YjjG family noncanonical pyrimidine nucleotidase [Flavobacterium sp.]|jgi:putative hydrolase of the HAD superfamily
MKNSTAITDVFFDLDHTLWDFEKNSALAFETVLAKHLPYIDVAAFLKVYVPLNFAYWERYRKDEITQEELRLGRLRDTFAAMNCDVSEEMLAFLSHEYIHVLPDYNHLFEGATEILDYLKTKYRLHIITNGFDKVQYLKISNANLGHYFTTVTNSEMAGVKKPNARIFEHALELASAKKETSIMIGDCIEADVRGAINCGIDAILFCAPDISYDGIKHVNHLSEIKNYL